MLRIGWAAVRELRTLYVPNRGWLAVRSALRRTLLRQVGDVLVAAASGVIVLSVAESLKARHVARQRGRKDVAALTNALRERTLRLESALAERAAFARAVELSESQFRVSFEQAAVGKVHAEPESGKIIRVNEAFCDMLGYTADELVGTDGWQLTHTDDVTADRMFFDQVVQGVVPRYIREKRYVRRDGTPIWVRSSVAVVRSPLSGLPLLAVAVVENIDEQRQYQLALEQAKSRLEHSLGELTAALRQRDLLLREVYHRVKNNLQIVDGLIMLQSRSIEAFEARQQLQQTRDRIYALGLVHHQLMGSDDLQTFNVRPFLVDLANNLATASGSGPVSVAVEAEAMKVDLDFAIPLGLIVTELVTNAFKHAYPSGAGVVTVTLLKDEEGKILLTVGDDGVASESGAGERGLGMKIVSGLLQQMRGSLEIKYAGGTKHTIIFEARDDHGGA